MYTNCRMKPRCCGTPQRGSSTGDCLKWNETPVLCLTLALWDCLGHAALSRVRTGGGWAGGGGGTSAARQGIALAAVVCCSGLAGTTGNRSRGGRARQMAP